MGQHARQEGLKLAIELSKARRKNLESNPTQTIRGQTTTRRGKKIKRRKTAETIINPKEAIRRILK